MRDTPSTSEGDTLELADKLHDLVVEALNNCNDKQRGMYELVHGVTIEGATKGTSVCEAARTLNLVEGSARFHLERAERSVWKHISLYYIRQEQLRNRTEVLFGTNTHAARVSFHREEEVPRSERFHLGTGSQAMITADKNNGRGSSTIDIHQRYATPRTPHTPNELLKRVWG